MLSVAFHPNALIHLRALFRDGRRRAIPTAGVGRSDPTDLRITTNAGRILNPVEPKAPRHAVSCRVDAIAYHLSTTGC